jgi:hypothetical protein
MAPKLYLIQLHPEIICGCGDEIHPRKAGLVGFSGPTGSSWQGFSRGAAWVGFSGVLGGCWKGGQGRVTCTTQDRGQGTGDRGQGSGGSGVCQHSDCVADSSSTVSKQGQETVKVVCVLKNTNTYI